MTEPEWLAAEDPNKMLDYLGDKASARKLQLFAVACCHRIAPLVELKGLTGIVRLSERRADDAAVDGELLSALAAPVDQIYGRGIIGGCKPVANGFEHWMDWEDAGDTIPQYGLSFYDTLHERHAAEAALWTTFLIWKKAWAVGERPLNQARRVAKDAAASRCFPLSAKSIDDHNKELEEHCMLLRHIFGNPLQPTPALVPCPLSVVGLAQALYDDLDNRFILADALEEAGCQALAEHFREEPLHPKGCWAMDLILQKA